jgi:4-hydroxy-3-polyprenylbenzoate decarboxylase
MRLIVGITGSTGVVYGVRLLERLRELEDVESHLVVTRHGELTMRLETDYELDYVRGLADVVHNVRDVGATIASGSFPTDGMIVAPCSIKTLSGIVNSYDENLMIRAADVTLKEKRRLVLVVRETPLHLGHLRLMTAAAEIGATIFPPVPAFYNRPDDLDDVIDQSVARMLDQVGIVLPGVRRWEGTTDRLHETE